MGDRLWAGKLSRYVASHLDQLSLPSLPVRLIEYQPFWLRRVAGNTANGVPWLSSVYTNSYIVNRLNFNEQTEST